MVQGRNGRLDIRQHPAPLIQGLLRDGLLQPSLRVFRGDPGGHGDIVYREGRTLAVMPGIYSDPRTCEAIPAPGIGPRDRPRLFCMGPNLAGHFVDAQGIGQTERDARRILNALLTDEVGG